VSITFPFLTAADPPATSEGALDPLGLYRIANQLAMQLVPDVRERMIRIRFLTAIAIGARITRDLKADPDQRDADPHLAWEWHVVESFIRSSADAHGEGAIWGVPGSLVARRAIDRYGHLDARSYLATPRVFGFHGVYKRLAHRVRIVNVHLGESEMTEPLIDAWARDRGLGGISGSEPLFEKWSTAIERALAARPPQTTPRWVGTDWNELAEALTPAGIGRQERKCLRCMLLDTGEHRIGALPDLWSLQQRRGEDAARDERLHDELQRAAPRHAPLIRAIRTYERFARAMQDAFDVLRHRAGMGNDRGFALSGVGADDDFRSAVAGLDGHFAAALEGLEGNADAAPALPGSFADQFRDFAARMQPGEVAVALWQLHKQVQDDKSADGKRPWFNDHGNNVISVRPRYRIDRPALEPDRYVHAYRGGTINRFFRDLGSQ
jgi:hypothetical protein